MFNITKQILEYGRALNLQPVMTGGGCDFMVKTNEGREPMLLTEADKIQEDHFDLIMGSKEDVASSPDSLDEPSSVVAYVGVDAHESGEHLCIIDFYTAREAMQFMAEVTTVDDIVAMVEEVSREVDDDVRSNGPSYN